MWEFSGSLANMLAASLKAGIDLDGEGLREALKHETAE